jgi:hypothetical protein
MPLTVPYVTAAEFRAAPTWLDTDDLIPGGAAARQDAELTNVLIRASEWANNVCNHDFGLKARSVTERLRGRYNRRGILSIHASMLPVRQVTAISIGSDPTNLQTVTDLSGLWIEHNRQILLPWTTPIMFGPTVQFGPPVVTGVELYVQMTYTAGFASTVLASAANAAATSISPLDVSGIMPGDVLRMWDPGVEEAVTVSSAYVPGAASVSLTGGLASAHAATASLSGMPGDIHQAVIAYAVALLLRQDVSSEEPFAGAPYGPAARRSKKGGKSGGLVDEAQRLLAPYRRMFQ